MDPLFNVILAGSPALLAVTVAALAYWVRQLSREVKTIRETLVARGWIKPGQD